ncbi:MAG: protoporphyrinogen oxidase [Elusimicrobiota bacterium]|jgi:oxygen-dependent protoporphyrinogen oxidase
MSSRVLIIGGGITGLSCAYELNKLGASRPPCCPGGASALKAQDGQGSQVCILEASSRLGGKLLGASIQGVPVDAGPDAMLSVRPWAVELACELGLEQDILCTDRFHREVYVYSRGKLRRYPEGVMMLMPSRVLPFLASDILAWKDKLRMGMEFFVPPLAGGQEESLGDFGRRRFGEGAVRSIVEPVLAGIYAGDVERLSLDSTFPRLRELEQEHGSVLRGMFFGGPHGARAPGARTFFVTLREGLAQLSETLARRMAPCARLESPVRRLFREDDLWHAELDGGEVLPADCVVLAAPADACGRMLAQSAPKLSAALSEFEFSSTAAVNLLYGEAAAKRIPKGFGFLVERGSGLSITAATFVSSKFPGRAPEDRLLLRAYIGGKGREAPLALDDGKLVSAVREDLRRVLGLEEEPLGSLVHRWPQANALYNVGHGRRLLRVQEAAAAYPGLLLAGGCYRGIGVPECVRSGREAGRRILSSPGGSVRGVVV